MSLIQHHSGPVKFTNENDDAVARSLIRRQSFNSNGSNLSVIWIFNTIRWMFYQIKPLWNQRFSINGYSYHQLSSATKCAHQRCAESIQCSIMQNASSGTLWQSINLKENMKIETIINSLWEIEIVMCKNRNIKHLSYQADHRLFEEIFNHEGKQNPKR